MSISIEVLRKNNWRLTLVYTSHSATGEKIEIETWCLLSLLSVSGQKETFMSLFGYGDVIYKHGSPECLHILHSVYSGTMGFITNFNAFTHPCASYAELGSSALSCCRFSYYVYLYVDFLFRRLFLVCLNLIYWLMLIMGNLGSMFHHFVCPRSSNGIWKRRIQIYHS